MIPRTVLRILVAVGGVLLVAGAFDGAASLLSHRGDGFVHSAQADLVRLKNGGDLRGQVDRRSGPTSADVQIETLTGALVVVERAHIQFVTRRSVLVEEYETQARKVAETVDDQWALAEWCKKNALRTQRETHLARVVELDPEHEAAHVALGHVMHDGQWTTRDELLTSQGYVRHKGKYITPQELELIEKSKAELESEREWFGKVRLWHGWLNGKNDDRRNQGLANLTAITDPNAVPALSKSFRGESNKAMRSLYVKVLRGIVGNGAAAALAWQYLNDDDSELRWLSLNGLDEDDAETARGIFLKELKSKSNPMVCRAGQGLERVGDESCVTALIQALTTVHTYQMQVPEKKGSVSFGTNGQFSLGGGGAIGLSPELQALIASGQVPPEMLNPSTGPPEKVRLVTFKHRHENQDVLSALQKITGQSFGFDKRSWNLWWTSKKSSGT